MHHLINIISGVGFAVFICTVLWLYYLHFLVPAHYHDFINKNILNFLIEELFTILKKFSFVLIYPSVTMQLANVDF